MRETIFGSTIIAVGIIAAAFIINQKDDYRPHHPMPNPHHMKHDKPMVWIDKDMGELSLGDQSMVFLPDDSEKHIVMKKMKKPMPGSQEDRKIIIKMRSDDSDSFKETIDDVMKDLSVNISVNMQSEKSDEDIQSLTQEIIDSVNDAVEGFSGEVNIDIQINESE